MADENAEYWNNKGDEFCDSKNFEEAIKCYEKAARKDPDNADTFNNWGFALVCLAAITQNEILFREAIEKFEQAAKKDPDNAVIFRRWGSALADLAEIKKDETLYREAIEKYKEAAEKDPDNAVTFNNWGYALAGLAEIKKDEPLYREAFEKYKEAAEKTPDNAHTFNNWGSALTGLAGIKKDEPLYREVFEKYKEAAEKDPDDTVALINWGYALAGLAGIKQDETLYREAIAKYKGAAEKDPDNAVTFNNWGYALAGLAEIEKDETLYGEAFEKYKEAAGKAPNDVDIFRNWGSALANLAKIKQDETLYREAFEKFEQAAEKDPDNADTFIFWGNALAGLAEIKQDEPLYREAFTKYKEAAGKDPDNADTFNNWGFALVCLAAITQNEILFREAIEKFEQVAKKDPDNVYSFIFWGYALAFLAEITQDETIIKTLFEGFYRESDSLKKLNRDILGICIIFKKKIQKMINIEKYFPLLDLQNDDSVFFIKTTEGITDTEELDKYKRAYILSVLIISQLHVNNENEQSAAYYSTKDVAQAMLFNGEAFRLNAVNYSNDPTEGKILLDYLFGEVKYPPRELNTGYGAFAGCFTFNHDSLNQFRLYGKADNREGTGLSLVFKDTFFSTKPEMAVKQHSVSLEDKRQALFRCIYIDPMTRRVETVGHKEEYLFYRENYNRYPNKDIEKKIKSYNGYITGIINNVQREMKELQKLVKTLKPEIAGQLLINLRYLTKHIAFKEEQECRIINIHPMNTETVKIKPPLEKDKEIQIDNIKQLYIEYMNITGHIKKIHFGPNASQMELFQDLLRYNDLNISCERSRNPLA